MRNLLNPVFCLSLVLFLLVVVINAASPGPWSDGKDNEAALVQQRLALHKQLEEQLALAAALDAEEADIRLAQAARRQAQDVSYTAEAQELAKRYESVGEHLHGLRDDHLIVAPPPAAVKREDVVVVFGITTSWYEEYEGEYRVDTSTISKGGNGHGRLAVQDTVAKLLQAVGHDDHNKVAVVVQIAEPDPLRSLTIQGALQKQFAAEIQSGVVILCPMVPEAFYPFYPEATSGVTIEDPYKESLGFAHRRVKRNVDVSHLLKYSYGVGGKYFVLLEDDSQFQSDKLFQELMNHIDRHESDDQIVWHGLQLSNIRTAGTVVRTHNLWELATFIKIFRNEYNLNYLIRRWLQIYEQWTQDFSANPPLVSRSQTVSDFDRGLETSRSF
eukprot:Clim_evm9s50 gene=Clim_evmTU9s50